MYKKSYVKDFGDELLNRACKKLKAGKVNNETFLKTAFAIDDALEEYYDCPGDEVTIISEMLDAYKGMEAKQNEN